MEASTPKYYGHKTLDELFDALSELPKTSEAEASEAIRTPLLSHQKMALHWMMARENSRELPPFWEEIRADRDYFNPATGTHGQSVSELLGATRRTAQWATRRQVLSSHVVR